MDAGQRTEVDRLLQNRKQDKLLDNSAMAGLKAFVAQSTAKLAAKHITPDEHNRELFLVAAQQREVDPFTGMFNKEGFNNELETALELARELKIPLTVASIDGDGFGQINKHSELGYEVGNRVILAVAKAIQESAKRETDIKAHIEGDSAPITKGARQGGDEFVLIFLGTDLKGAQIVINRTRNNVTTIVDAKVPEYRRCFGRPLTISVGSAEFDPEVDDAKSLMARADIALRAEKRLKKFGNVPLPDFFSMEKLETWIGTWVKVPLPAAENDPVQLTPEQRLAQERRTLMRIADYAVTNPEIRTDALNILTKAATRKAV